MATHSSILAWKISWTEEPGGLQPIGHQESDTTEHTHTHTHTHTWVLKNFLLLYFSVFQFLFGSVIPVYLLIFVIVFVIDF